MESDGFTICQLSLTRLQTKSRLFRSALCPDKDLFLLVGEHGHLSKLSLWSMNGSKKWEVDVGEDGATDEITALAWGPDGKTIVVAHHPPRISIHSIEDGKEERTIPITKDQSSVERARIVDVYWFQTDRPATQEAIPDIFKRENTVTGSAHSIMKMLPLLDPLQDEQPPPATSLFRFAGSQARPAQKTAPFLPDSIACWPSLPPDVLLASIQPHDCVNSKQSKRPGEELDGADRSHVDSLLVVLDAVGQIHCFLDGSYALGSISLGTRLQGLSISKPSKDPVLYVHAAIRDSPLMVPANLSPITIKLPLLQERATRHVAEACTSARELMWYALRLVKQMQKTWFGEDGNEGIKQTNLNWLGGLEERQASFEQDKHAIYDLTVFLTTAKASEALIDFFSSGEQTSDRGLQKWDETVSDGLRKIFDYAEKRVAPACQRLHLILEEAKGWSLLPQLYGPFDFKPEEIDACLELCGRAIFIAAWLAATARREFLQFQEFMKFIVQASARLNPANGEPLIYSPRFDILEANAYMMSGLQNSAVENFFTGNLPRFDLESVASDTLSKPLSTILEEARNVVGDPSRLTWPSITKSRDLSRLDRNLELLVQELGQQCQQVFSRTAKAVVKTAMLQHSWLSEEANAHMTSHVTPLKECQIHPPVTVRERTVQLEGGNGLQQHLAVRVQETTEGKPGKEMLCVFSMVHTFDGAAVSCKASVAVIRCTLLEDETSEWLDVSTDAPPDDFTVCDLDFFDEESLVVVYKLSAVEGPASVGMVPYVGIPYAEVDTSLYVKTATREEIVADVIRQVRTGQVRSAAVAIRRKQALRVAADGGALAVNGRAGRRVACVLSGDGLDIEALDMAAEDEGGEEGGEEGGDGDEDG